MKTYTIYRTISDGYEDFKHIFKEGLTEIEAKEMVDDLNEYSKWEPANREYFSYSESD
jgi:hypothetical protein